MDIKNLQENYLKLLEHMQDAGYSKNYMQQIRYEILLIFKQPNKWISYEEIIQAYEKQFDKKKAGAYRTKIRLIKRFDLDGKLPRDPKHPKDWNYCDNAYQHLLPEFKELIDYYKEHSVCLDKKKSTIRNECLNTAAFLYKLQLDGIITLHQIDQNTIINSLTGDDDLPLKSASYVNQIRAIFRETTDYSDECNRIFQLLPVMRKRRKNIQYLKSNERNSIKNVLKNEESSMNLRDKAIGCLLYYTGLRCSDISNLRFVDIDWENDEITIQQQKTDVPMKLPLPTIVGNAIYDYIVSERRNSECEYIFLSQSYPFEKMTSKAIGGRTYPLFREADIRKNPGDRKGGHIFRHNFATSMLENGASRAVISRAMGHTSPDSTDGYLSADMVHLKECSISIESFPVRKGVFTSERI